MGSISCIPGIISILEKEREGSTKNISGHLIKILQYLLGACVEYYHIDTETDVYPLSDFKIYIFSFLLVILSKAKRECVCHDRHYTIPM